MNYHLSFGTKFKRDFKTIKKRGYPIGQMAKVLEILEKSGILPFEPRQKMSKKTLNSQEIKGWKL